MIGFYKLITRSINLRPGSYVAFLPRRIQTKDYEANHLIIYCLNCIRQGRNATYEPGLRFDRPFPSSLVSLFQSESKCETILMKMTLICKKMKLHAELIFIWKVSHLRPWQTRTHCCPWCFLGCANWETFVADTKCFWTKSETFLCPGHKICVRNKCCGR